MELFNNICRNFSNPSVKKYFICANFVTLVGTLPARPTQKSAKIRNQTFF